MSFFRKKTLESIKESSANSGLSKTLTAFDLVLLGLGAIIGSGIFVLTGLVAAQHSGPAVTVSYAIAGLTCVFVALAYTELASMIPTSGSVYTYTFVTFGEVVAWLMGGVLILELGFGAAAVSSAWSSYVQGVLDSAGIHLPVLLSTDYTHGGLVNLPAIFITAIVCGILYRGTKDSKKMNAILVFIKMAAVTAFIIASLPHFDLKNWENFTPHGFDDVLVGSSILFFAFTGFGALATSAEECKNPQRDLLIGVVGSLVLSTLVYIAVGALATGIVPYYELDNAQPLATALKLNGSNMGAIIVATGGICGMTTVIMMNIFAQSRIFYVMSRDGLLPQAFSRLNAKTDSPNFAIISFSIFTGLLGGFFPIEIISKLSSMGALVDYCMVTLMVMIFRVKFPELPRTFKCPALFIVAPVALFACGYLLSKQIFDKDWGILLTGKLLGFWLVAMFVLYVIRKPSIKQSI